MRWPPSRALVLLALTSAAVAACRGRVTGKAATVVTADGRPASLSGKPVYLVPATSVVLSRVAAACESTIAYVGFHPSNPHRRSESSLPKSDTGDASADFPHSPERLLPVLALATVQVDAQNRFAFDDVASGRYFVVAPSVGWAGVEVTRGTKKVLLTVDSPGACTAVGATSWSR